MKAEKTTRRSNRRLHLIHLLPSNTIEYIYPKPTNMATPTDKDTTAFFAKYYALYSSYKSKIDLIDL